MDTKTMIVDFIKENSIPNQELCPELTVFWHGNDKHGAFLKTYNLKTNEIMNHEHNDIRRLRREEENQNKDFYSSRGEIFGVYINFIPELLMMEVSCVGIDGTRPKYDEENNLISRNWEFEKRRFFFYGDPNFYNEQGEAIQTNFSTKFYNKAGYCYLGEVDRLNCHNVDNVTIQLELFFETINDTPSRFFNTWNEGHYLSKHILPFWLFREYYKRSLVPRKKKDDEMKELNNLCKTVNLEEIKEISKQINDENYHFFLFEQLTDTISVIRYYGQGYSGYYNHTNNRRMPLNPYERERVFITPQGVFIYVYNTQGWNRYSNKYSSKYSKHYIWDRDGKMFSQPPLKYIKNVVDWEPSTLEVNNKGTFYCAKHGVEKIISILRHPIVENLAKAGYDNIAQSVASNSEVAANLRNMFGCEKETSDIYKATGLNKYQLTKLNSFKKENSYYHYSEVPTNVIQETKRILGLKELSHLSNSDTDFWFNHINMCLNEYHVYINSLVYDISPLGTISLLRIYRWDNRDILPLTDVQKKNIKKVFKLADKCKKENPTFRALNIFHDIVRLFCALSEEYRPNIDLYSIDSSTRLQNVHDMLLELCRMERQKVDANKEKEMQKKLDKFNKKRKELFIDTLETSKYDHFIKLPQKPSEIIEEGMKLSHCVGSYTTSVCEGNTNILFLREKNNPDKPFYTIEVSSSNGRLDLIQIHGFGNKWLGNNPEAIQFVLDWLKACKINFKRNILLCTATGYGNSGASCLSENIYNWN